MKYLKKRKLTLLAKQVVGCKETDKVIVTRYSFCRGTEFLDFYIDEKCYKVCFMKCCLYFSLESWIYDDDFNIVNFNREIIDGFEIKRLISLIENSNSPAEQELHK